MRRFLILLAVISFTLTTQPAEAVKPFFDQFVKLYIDENSDEEFAKLVTKEAKCYVCHQGKKKKNRNAYGQALEEFLTKKDGKDVDKIVEALKKVGEMKTDPEDDESPTYDEQIAEGKLPAGELEDLKKEPESE